MSNKKNETSSSRNEDVKFIQDELTKLEAEIREIRDCRLAIVDCSLADGSEEEFIKSEDNEDFVFHEESGFYFYLLSGSLQLAIVYSKEFDQAFVLRGSIEERKCFWKLNETHFLYDEINGDRIERTIDSQGVITLIYNKDKLDSVLFQPYNSSEVPPYVFYQEWDTGKGVFCSTGSVYPTKERLALISTSCVELKEPKHELKDLLELLRSKAVGTFNFYKDNQKILELELTLTEGKDYTTISAFQIFEYDEKRRLFKHQAYIV